MTPAPKDIRCLYIAPELQQYYGKNVTLSGFLNNINEKRCSSVESEAPVFTCEQLKILRALPNICTEVGIEISALYRASLDNASFMHSLPTTAMFALSNVLCYASFSNIFPDFTNSTGKLLSLKIVGNFSYVPANCTGQLTTVEMRINNFQNELVISEHAFDNLADTLLYLNLFNTTLCSVPFALNTLSSLRYLNFSNLLILESGVNFQMTGNAVLKVLDISNNAGIDKFTNRCCGKKCHQSKKPRLDNEQTLASGLQTSLRNIPLHITELYIKNQHIMNISFIFPFTRLRKLDVSNNLIREFPSGQLLSEQLETINFDNNNLELEVDLCIFNNSAHTLSDISFSYNSDISFFSKNCAFPSLRVLRLDFTHLDSLSTTADFAPGLTYLTLRGNDFHSIPVEIKLFGSLIELDMSNCLSLDGTVEPSTFGGTQLTVLKLGRFSNLPSTGEKFCWFSDVCTINSTTSIFIPRMERGLNFNNESFAGIQDKLLILEMQGHKQQNLDFVASLTQLNHLNISNNLIHNWPIGILFNQHLLEFDTSYNYIEGVVDLCIFKHSINLESILLHFNNIEVIHTESCLLPKLLRLQLDSNKLTLIPRLKSLAPALDILIISQNPLQDIQYDLPKSLTSLTLSIPFQIQCLDGESFPGLPNLEELVIFIDEDTLNMPHVYFPLLLAYQWQNLQKLKYLLTRSKLRHAEFPQLLRYLSKLKQYTYASRTPCTCEWYDPRFFSFGSDKSPMFNVRECEYVEDDLQPLRFITEFQGRVNISYCNCSDDNCELLRPPIKSCAQIANAFFTSIRRRHENTNSTSCSPSLDLPTQLLSFALVNGIYTIVLLLFILFLAFSAASIGAHMKHLVYHDAFDITRKNKNDRTCHCEKVGIDGLKDFHNAAGTKSRVFWAALLVLAVAAFSFYTHSTLLEFATNSMVSLVDQRTASTLPLPEIMICPPTPTNKTYMDENLLAADKRLNDLWLPLLIMSANRNSSIGLNLQTMKYFDSRENDFHFEDRSVWPQNSTSDFFDTVGYKKLEFIKSLDVSDVFSDSYEAKITLDDVKSFVDPAHGKCFILGTQGYNMRMGSNIRLIIDVHSELMPKTGPSLDYAKGVFVMFHTTRMSYPSLRQEYFARAGEHTKLSIKATVTKRLDQVNDVRCVEDANFQYCTLQESKYSREACIIDCISSFFVSNCNCVPFGQNGYFDNRRFKDCTSDELQYCANELFCISEVVPFQYGRRFYANETAVPRQPNYRPKPCSPREVEVTQCIARYCSYQPCKGWDFDALLQTKPLSRSDTGAMERDWYLLRSQSAPLYVNGSRWPDNYAILDIAYASMQYTFIEQSPTSSVAELVSNIGGQIGLWLGASMFTLVQLIVYLCCELVNHVRKRRRGSFHINSIRNRYHTGSLRISNNINSTHPRPTK